MRIWEEVHSLISFWWSIDFDFYHSWRAIKHYDRRCVYYVFGVVEAAAVAVGLVEIYV